MLVGSRHAGAAMAVLILQFHATELHAASGWNYVESLSTERMAPVGVVIDGTWLVAGGVNQTPPPVSFPAAIELFTPSTGHWQQVGRLRTGREYLQALADPNTKEAFFVGGILDVPVPDATVGRPNAWRESTLTTPRYGHASAFAAGRVIVSGGSGLVSSNAEATIDTVESWASETERWSLMGSIPGGPRVWHTMTTLADGRHVLIAGGCLAEGPSRKAFVLDAATGTWSEAPDMTRARCRHGATLLSDGRVLVSGAISESAIAYLPDSEIYDFETNSWSPAAPMRFKRNTHAAVLLPNGRVLVAGGTDDPIHGELGALASVEIYDPASDSWSVGPPMQERRWWLIAAVLEDAVYVAGGVSGTPTPSAKDPSMSDVGQVMISATTERLSMDDLARFGGSGCGCRETSTESTVGLMLVLLMCLVTARSRAR